MMQVRDLRVVSLSGEGNDKSNEPGLFHRIR